MCVLSSQVIIYIRQSHCKFTPTDNIIYRALFIMSHRHGRVDGLNVHSQLVSIIMFIKKGKVRGMRCFDGSKQRDELDR